MSEEMITIGEITRHQGNKGEVRVKALTDYPERFEELETVFLTAGREEKEVEIEAIRYHKGFVIIKFMGFDNIEDAINHKGYKVQIRKLDSIDLPEDNYFFYQIMGLDVYTIEDEYLGKVVEILETEANDVYRVEDKGKEILIPALKKVVQEVNLEAGELIVKLLPGLR